MKKHWFDEVVTEKGAEKSNGKHPANSLSPSKNCVELLEHFEGFKSIAYLDTIAQPPVWTMGHGLTRGVKKGDTISYEDSVKRKIKEMQIHWDGVKNNINVEITQDMCDALTSWIYNIGVGAASKSTLVRVLNQEDYLKAADELLRWNKAGGKTVNGLTRRRKAERELFIGDNWRKFYV